MITTPRPIPIVTVVSARELVHSNKVVSGDWAPAPGTCDCLDTDEFDMAHFCAESNTWALLQMFDKNEFSQSFIDSVLSLGISHPIYIEPMRYSGTMILRNGHHRLAIAYKYNLMVPVRIAEWEWDQADADYRKYQHLPYSTETTESGMPVGGMSLADA